MGWYNFFALITSMVAVSISGHSWWVNRRMLKSKRELEISSPLYNEHLIRTIPQAFDKLIDGEDNREILKEFSSEMKKIRSDLRYFRFAHQKIYRKLSGIFEEIDVLMVASFEKTDSLKDYEHFQEVISQKLDSIYKVLLYDLPDDRIEQYFHLN